jgi:hypothetical protein
VPITVGFNDDSPFSGMLYSLHDDLSGCSALCCVLIVSSQQKCLEMSVESNRDLVISEAGNCSISLAKGFNRNTASLRAHSELFSFFYYSAIDLVVMCL